MVNIEFNLNDALAIQKGEKPGSIKSRDGKPARIICTDAMGNFPIVALIDGGGVESPSTYTERGRNDYRDNVTTNMDLVLEVEGSPCHG